MKNLLIDTNVVLDLLAKRQPFYKSAAQLFSLSDRSNLNLSISSLTIANTNYVLTNIKSKKFARKTLRRFKVLVKICPLTEKVIDLALNDGQFPDFEDGLQYYTAIENDLDIIITRDLRGFKSSKIPTMTAEEYLLSQNK